MESQVHFLAEITLGFWIASNFPCNCRLLGCSTIYPYSFCGMARSWTLSPNPESNWVHEISWNAPKSMWKRILSCDSIFSIFWNAPKSKNFIFGAISVLKLITWQFFEMPHFFIFEFFEMPHFPHFQNQIWKMEHFKKFEHKWNRKWNSSILGHFKKMWTCYHMTKSSFTCFLGHFMVPLVFKLNHSINDIKVFNAIDYWTPVQKCLL